MVPREDEGRRDFSRPFEGVPWREIGKYLINAVKAILLILPFFPTSIPLPSLSIKLIFDSCKKVVLDYQ